ncbi:hypothetical protein N9358_01875 [Flavobacteriales bacterium]|nr:hypothetical protein [Flavobacteriales bacterium]
MIFFTQISANCQVSQQLVNIKQSSLLNTVSPFEGSLGYEQNKVHFYNGNAWVSFNDFWKLNGNNNIGNNQYIGCSNNHDFIIRTNNTNRIAIKSGGNVGVNNNNPTAKFQVNGSNANDLYVAINGNVGIGTSNPTQRLHVIGNVVANAFNTPDYVFETYFDGHSEHNPSYSFYGLDEIYQFVKENKHLPNVPSAKEVKEKGGIVLNKANEKNLEKIEELFLHLIELKKQSQELEKRLNDLE